MTLPKANSAIVTILTNRIAAIQKYLVAEKPEIPVNGVLMKPAAMVKVYKKSLSARADVLAGASAHKEALAARDAAEGDRLAVDENLKAWVLGRFGANSSEAGEFGFAARKAPTVTAATRAHAVEQNKATRAARGTVGKKQKLKIKGVVPTTTAPAAPATPSTTVPSNAVVVLSAPLTTAPSASAPAAASAPVAGASATTLPPTATPAVASVLVPAVTLTNGVTHS